MALAVALDPFEPPVEVEEEKDVSRKEENLNRRVDEILAKISSTGEASLTREERRPYIQLAQSHQAEIEAVFFDVPLAVCLERNRRRPRQVPEDILAKMSAKLQPPTHEEGFHKILKIP